MELAQKLRHHAWDIVEDWLEESKLTLSGDEIYPPSPSETIVDELPTLIGGITKVIQDPLYLMDLEPGGNLHEVARQFGRLRYENGHQIDGLLNDFSLLRRKLWLYCERALPEGETGLFELERRLSLALDRMTATAVDTYYRCSCAELIELAQRDKLTGFLHSKAFYRLLDSELARSKRYHYPLTLVSADLDDFKSFNLEEGRLAGNRLLQEIAGEIMSVIRGTDLVARIGGDEFAMILPQTDLDEARIAAERLRRRIRQMRRGDRLITLSVGMAVYPKDAENKSRLVDVARLALRSAQQNGGDVVRTRSGP